LHSRIELFNQIILFRFSFPFGRPEGALKATLSLLERVLTKDISAPISREDIRYFIRKCLENAAYTNYTRVSDQAKIEGNLMFIFFYNKKQTNPQDEILSLRCCIYLLCILINLNHLFYFSRRTRDSATK
jgi:hypothetical protein